MANIWRFPLVGLLLLLLGGWAAGQGTPREHQLKARLRTLPVKVDGRLGEWRQVDFSGHAIELRQPGQVLQAGKVKKGGWKGHADLSGRIYLAYTPTDLYVFGRVNDQRVVAPEPGGECWSGDALELFLDLDLADDLAVPKDKPGPANEDDYQIFLLPGEPGRPWGVAVKDEATGKFRLVDQGWSGVEVAFQRQRLGYTFEARFPFHNFKRLEPGVEEIGFNIALGDHDRPGGDKYTYMIWTGRERQPAADTRVRGRLRFDPGMILADPGETGRELGRDLFAVLEVLIFPLFLLLLLGVAYQLDVRFLSARLRLRWVVFGVSIVLVTAGLTLPGSMARWRQSANRAELRRTAGQVAGWVRSMAGGTLDSYRGARRDGPLIDLLAGKSVKRVPDYLHRPVDLGPPPVRFPDAHRVKPYGIPLAGEETGPGAETVTLREPRREGTLVVTITYEESLLLDPPAAGPALRLRLTPVEAGEPVGFDLPEERWIRVPERRLLGARGEEGRWAAYAEVPVPPAGIRAVGFEVLTGVGMRLEGMTWIAPGAVDTGEPLPLGRTTLSGVPTNLYGSYPREAGTLLRPGAEVSWEIPSSEGARAWERVWLITSAVPGTEDVTPVGAKEPVARVRFAMVGAEGKPETWLLRHQVHVFNELADENSALESLGQGQLAGEVAFRWRSPDSPQEERISVVASHTLRGKGSLQRVTVKNTSSYTIHVWDLILGIRKARVPIEPEGSVLSLTMEGESVELKDEVKRALQGCWFAIYRDRYMQPGCTLDVGGALEGVEMPRRGYRALETGEVQVGTCRLVQEGTWYESFIPLEGEGWAGTVLSVIRQDAGFEYYQRIASLVGLLVAGLALPFLFVLVVQWLVGLRTLRLKLVGSLALAAAVPLVLLSLFLVQVLERGHYERSQERLREELDSVLVGLGRESRTLLDEVAGHREAMDRVVRAGRRNLAAGRLDKERFVAGLRRELMERRPDRTRWGEKSFARLDLEGLPHKGPSGGSLVIYDSKDSRILGDAASPLRGVSFSLRWGIPFYSARVRLQPASDKKPQAGDSLVFGGALDDRMAGRIVQRSSLVVYDLEGYPLAWAAGTGTGALTRPELSLERTWSRMGEKRLVIGALQKHKALQTGRFDGGRSGVFQTVKDVDGRPRAVIGLLERTSRPTLSLAVVGTVGVRNFFGAVGAVILVLVLFVAWLVTGRVSRPLERLRTVTGRLTAGELDVRLPEEGTDEIAQLAGSFNRMAGQLQARMRDTVRLNRALRDFTSHLDPEAVGRAACTFLAQVVEPVRALVVIPEKDDRLLLLDSTRPSPQRLRRDDSPLLRLALEAEAPTRLQAPFPDGSLVEAGEVLIQPMRLGDQVPGAIVLHAAAGLPDINPDFLETLAGQVAVALENARLFILAIEDPQTGAYVATYFRERLAQEVDRARRSGRSLALIRLSLDNLEGVAEQYGPVAAGRVAAAAAAQIREHLDRPFLLGWLGRSDYELLLPETDRETAQDLAGRLVGHLVSRPLEVGGETPVHLQVSAGTVSCPEDAESAQFLVDAAERILVRSRRREGVAGADLGLAGAKVATPVITVAGQEMAVRSDTMQTLLRTVERVSGTTLTVLLLGETGVGKEVFADLVHNLSARAERPLIKVNCSAFPESLLESELFGHEKGAFTGADSRKQGRFELAHGGTLFLDEVGEMSLPLQVKLLRVLQDQRFERLGGGEPIQVDVRIIAATNRNLEEAIRVGSFREDLYFRLKVVSLVLPPLRERKEDIPPLVEIFRKRFCAEADKHIAGFSAESMDRLYTHSWPGNIRELRNVVTRAMYLAGGEVVEVGDLALEKGGPVSPAMSPTAAAPAAGGEEAGLTPRQGRLLALLRERGEITTREYVEVAGISRRTGLRDLAILVDRGLAVREGRRKGAVYKLSGA